MSSRGERVKLLSVIASAWLDERNAATNDQFRRAYCERMFNAAMSLQNAELLAAKQDRQLEPPPLEIDLSESWLERQRAEQAKVQGERL